MDAVAQLEELVAVAREHRVHARLCVESLGERPGDRERHVLLARAAVADRPRILAAVTGVDRDDDVTVAFARGVHRAHRLRILRPGRKRRLRARG